jgi:hypothetical protein
MKQRTNSIKAQAGCRLKRRINKNLRFLTFIMAVAAVATIGQAFMI